MTTANVRPISGLPLASTLTGLETFPAQQNGAAVSVTAGRLAGLVSVASKAQLGLGNVDNTSDINKPVSTATAAALAGKLAPDGPADNLTLSGQTLAGTLMSFLFGTPTVATLRTFPTFLAVSGSVISVSGYYAQGDGGGGPFVWSSTSSAADDGALVIKPTAVSGAGRWIRLAGGGLSIRMFGVKGDGVADDGPATRAAYVACTSFGLRVLTAPAGLYRIATSVILTEGVELRGVRDAVFRCADNGPNIMFECSPVNNVGFTGITIDGNAANNSANYDVNNKALIHFRSANGAFARGVTFLNGPGIGIAGYGDDNDYSDNVFKNVRDRAVFHIGLAGAYAKNLTVRRNNITGPMAHAINIGFEDGFDVSNNVIRGHVIGLRSSMRVNVSGFQVTYSGGPENFANVAPGEFLVMSGGKEYYITAKSGNTITVTPDGAGNPPPAGNSQIAMVGSGDLIGIDSVRNGKVSNNLVGAASTFGGGVISSGGAVSDVDVTGNHFYNTGKHGWAVSAEAPSAVIARVKLIGNTFDEAGSGADAISDFDRSSIIIAAGPGAVKDIFVDGNAVASDTAVYGPVYNWLGFDLTMKPGTVFLGKGNVSTTFNGARIANDVKSITLSAGWGSTATVDGISSTGARVSLTIRASGTGFGGYPTGVVSKVSDVGPQPAVQAFLRSSAGTGDIRFPIVSDNASAGNWPFLWTSGDAPSASTVFVSSLVAQ